MTQKYFMINEVASLHNMTRKTLHYYDKIGLFSPEYTDEKTGYRYYKREQFPFLKEIIYLKDLGFNLKEIKVLLEERDFTDLINALNERLLDVNKTITALNRTKQDLEFLIDHYQTVQHINENDLYRPSVKIYPQRTICYENCNEDVSKESVMRAYRKILKTLTERDLFSHMPYGTLYFKVNQVAAFISLPQSLGLENEIILPAGKYITMYKKGSYYDEKSIKFLENWLAQEGYKQEGPFIDFSLIDYTFTNDEKQMIQELQIKVA